MSNQLLTRKKKLIKRIERAHTHADTKFVYIQSSLWDGRERERERQKDFGRRRWKHRMIHSNEVFLFFFFFFLAGACIEIIFRSGGRDALMLMLFFFLSFFLNRTDWHTQKSQRLKPYAPCVGHLWWCCLCLTAPSTYSMATFELDCAQKQSPMWRQKKNYKVNDYYRTEFFPIFLFHEISIVVKCLALR